MSENMIQGGSLTPMAMIHMNPNEGWAAKEAGACQIAELRNQDVAQQSEQKARDQYNTNACLGTEPCPPDRKPKKTTGTIKERLAERLEEAQNRVQMAREELDRARMRYYRITTAASMGDMLPEDLVYIHTML